MCTTYLLNYVAVVRSIRYMYMVMRVKINDLNWTEFSLLNPFLLKFLQKISFIGLNPGPGLLSFLQVFQISFSMSSQKISSFDRKSLNGNWEQNRILWCIQNILLSSSFEFNSQ